MFFDLPTMQTCRLNVSKLHLFKISITPAGVAGRRYGLPELNLHHKRKQLVVIWVSDIALPMLQTTLKKVPCSYEPKHIVWFPSCKCLLFTFQCLVH